MGFRDLLRFYLVAGFSLRWISTAAAAGPSAVVIWLMGCAALYVRWSSPSSSSPPATPTRGLIRLEQARLRRLRRVHHRVELLGLPWWPPVAIGLATLGFATTALSIGLAIVPTDDQPNTMLAVTKVVGLTALLVVIGAAVYFTGRHPKEQLV
jgi:hypothetical protein